MSPGISVTMATVCGRNDPFCLWAELGYLHARFSLSPLFVLLTARYPWDIKGEDQSQPNDGTRGDAAGRGDLQVVVPD